MNIIKAAVCDDEEEMTEELSERLSEFFSARNINAEILKFSCGASLLKYVQNGGEFDIVFLDIKMDAPDGMETARELRRRNYGGFLIFLTILEEQVFNAFEVSAFDYLVKPLDEKRFEKTMERLKNDLISSTVSVHKKGETRIVRLDEIVCCEVIDRKIYLRLSDGETVEFYERLDEFAEKLDSRFFKCHRSFMINFMHLKELCGNSAVMDSGLKVPVSRLRRDDFAEAFEKFMREWKI